MTGVTVPSASAVSNFQLGYVKAFASAGDKFWFHIAGTIGEEPW